MKRLAVSTAEEMLTLVGHVHALSAEVIELRKQVMALRKQVVMTREEPEVADVEESDIVTESEDDHAPFMLFRRLAWDDDDLLTEPIEWHS